MLITIITYCVLFCVSFNLCFYLPLSCPFSQILFLFLYFLEYLVKYILQCNVNCHSPFFFHVHTFREFLHFQSRKIKDTFLLFLIKILQPLPFLEFLSNQYFRIFFKTISTSRFSTTRISSISLTHF